MNSEFIIYEKKSEFPPKKNETENESKKFFLNV